ncbi:Vacuolar protein sorting-associated protein 36 [Zostera marina]|uniref:Vacuolar protein-sorting-associated protein 36 n=1 Tax=Zostera marina TaxID=29655 RepID=A0A0K9PRZ0_ZOSMR|nr:Vacuolar protein sorting-associated protein 36 [Zostera marina]
MNRQTWLTPANLTSSGRPSLLPDEIERRLLSSVDIDLESSSTPVLKSGLLSLTSHRLIWIDNKASSAFSIHLSSVVKVFPLKKNLFHSPRVTVQVSGGQRSSDVVAVIVIRGKNNDVDEFYGKLVKVWRERFWEITEERESARIDNGGGEGTSRPWAPPVVGVTGILRKEQETWENTDKSLQDSFQDLNALMSKAKEMVSLAERMRQTLLSGSNPQNTGNDEEMGSKQEMQDWLLSVGIASPVTRESAGALYHQQLSRELADFVRVPLESSGGMKNLIDIYCQYNRARGTELISPDDLLRACALWEKFDVPVMLRKFESGVMVIQSKTHSDDEVFSRISDLAVKTYALKKGISPSDAAITLEIAPALAKEQLLAAESKGILCRDISPEGFRFYINLFKDIDVQDMYRIQEHSQLHLWDSATSSMWQ